MGGRVGLRIDPRDRLALAEVLRGPVGALSDTALAVLSEPGRGISPGALGDLPPRASSLTADEMRRLVSFRGAFAAVRRAGLRAPPAEARGGVVAGCGLGISCWSKGSGLR